MDLSTSIPRQVILKRCVLRSPTRVENVDLLPYVQRLDIFENIFLNTISASITLMESVGLVELLPIVGVETLSITFSVLVDENVEHTFAKSFRVIKVRDVTYPRHSMRLYTLELATHEFVNSVSSRISRVFSNVTCEYAIKTILEKDLDVPFGSLVTVEPTFGLVNVTVPNYTPLQAIDYFTLLSQTIKTPRESNFLFFETLEGFHFTSVRNLIVAGKAQIAADKNHIPFKLNASALSQDTVEDEAVRTGLIRIHQDQTFDLMLDIAGGMLRSKMVHFDFLARKVAHEEDSRYTDSFDKTTHLANYPVYPKNYDQTVAKNTRVFTFPSNVWSANSKYIKNAKTETDEQRMYEAIVLRNRQLRELQHLQTLIDIPGHPELRAGAVIDLWYPSTPALEGSDAPHTDSIGVTATPFHSGLHLVTAVRHILTIQSGGAGMEYRMHVRVCRDSLGHSLVGFAAQP
jgi:hypothetical protein